MVNQSTKMSRTISKKEKIILAMPMRLFRAFARLLFGVVVVHPANHHFLPGLVAPRDGLGWVRIVEVLLGIVKMGGALDLRAGGDSERIFQAVDALPAEIVTGDGKQDFGAAVGVDRLVLEA